MSEVHPGLYQGAPCALRRVGGKPRSYGKTMRRTLPWTPFSRIPGLLMHRQGLEPWTPWLREKVSRPVFCSTSSFWSTPIRPAACLLVAQSPPRLMAFPVKFWCTSPVWYVIMALLLTLSSRKEVSTMHDLIGFIFSIIANVMSHYICKWLDGDE